MVWSRAYFYGPEPEPCRKFSNFGNTGHTYTVYKWKVTIGIRKTGQNILFLTICSVCYMVDCRSEKQSQLEGRSIMLPRLVSGCCTFTQQHFAVVSTPSAADSNIIS
jgi:hypothetical protein